MDLQTFSVSKRESAGKGVARKLRAQGKIPGVLYGQGSEAVPIVIDDHEFYILVHTKGGEHSFLDLAVEGDDSLNCRAMIKDVQHHPVRGHFLHVDLMRIDMNKKITTVVAVTLEGHCKGAIDGGVIDHQTRDLDIECLPGDMPEAIVVDITDLEIGQSVLVRDLAVMEGVTVLATEDRPIVSVHAPRVVVEATAEEGEEVDAEAEGEATPEGEDD